MKKIYCESCERDKMKNQKLKDEMWDKYNPDFCSHDEFYKMIDEVIERTKKTDGKVFHDNVFFIDDKAMKNKFMEEEVE